MINLLLCALIPSIGPCRQCDHDTCSFQIRAELHLSLSKHIIRFNHLYRSNHPFLFFLYNRFLPFNHAVLSNLQAPPTRLLHQLRNLDLILHDQAFPDWHRIKGSTQLTMLTLRYASAEDAAGGLSFLSDGMPLLFDTIDGLLSLRVLNIELAERSLSFGSFAYMYQFEDCTHTFAKITASVERRGGKVRCIDRF